ncbi:MAG: DUF456 domain-containing protein [Gemmatimonadota bacterium]
MSVFVLGLVLLVCLILVPLGLPGTWLMLGSAIVYDIVVTGNPIGWWAIGLATGLAVVGEIFEFTVAAKYTARYGGSRRAGWGAILGGLVGAFVGVPVPVVGSVIGAFVGSFLGALVAEFSRSEATTGSATRVATGALLGRVVATALKLALACTMVVVLVFGAIA